jgi:hypothetical protein
MKKQLFLVLVLVPAFLFSGTVFSAVELVREGKPTAEIIITKDAVQGIKLAAEELQKHLELISGARLPIVNAPSPDVKSQVYVGQSEFTKALGFKPAKFKSSGLEIVVKDNYVILTGPNKHYKESPYKQSPADAQYLFGGNAITGKTFPKPDNFPSPGLKKWQDFCGEKFTAGHQMTQGPVNNSSGRFLNPLGIFSNDDLGTWYAVSEFLEQLGVRWYMPGDDGTVIPDKKTITIVDQHLKKEAKFPGREWSYSGMQSDKEGITWLKRLKVGNYTTINFNHTTYAIYSSVEQQKLHPEYLARDAKGNPYLGYPSGRGMPRYTDPGFRKAAVTYMNKFFEAYPDMSAMAMGPPDGGVIMDARDISKYGKAGDSLDQKTSNYVWDFHVHLAKELKKSHPDRHLIYMTGAGAFEMPTNIEEFPDNILIPPAINGPTWVLDSNRRRLLARHRKWSEKMKVVRRAPSWDHWLYHWTPEHPRCPVVFTKSLQHQMKEMLPYMNRKFIEIQAEKAWGKGKKDYHWRLGVPGLVHLMVYWQNKLFWDPDADRKKILDEYYTLFYGPAEAEMREFYEFAEKVWARQESRSLTLSTGFLKEVDVDRYFEILAKARAKAGKGTVYDKRIAKIESEMQSLKKLFPNLKRTGPSVRAYRTQAPLKIDGELGEYKKYYDWRTLRDYTTGETPVKNVTHAVLTITPDKSALIVAMVCYENRMAELKADCKLKDNRMIFQDDVVEVYVNTPERSYFKIVVNPNGVVWDETTDVAIVARDTLPILWNPGVKAAVKKFPDRWTVEIMIPTKDFGKLGPTKTYPWGIQVGRTRFTGGTSEVWVISPTSGGPYKTMNRWGNLWVQ